MGFWTESPVTTGGEVALALRKRRHGWLGKRGNRNGCRLSRHVAPVGSSMSISISDE